ncbi:MAG: protein adenylyltransferase SelO family protein, partial [Verrucomicrobiales bacterium]|nr:protein adenylyltransferase SelO family protein [Verrucomicrobiales bacterium]
MTHLKNSYTNLPEYFYSREKADVPPQPEWIRGNDELATQLGFDLDWFHSSEGLALFSGQEVPEGIEPVALAYAGHQFGGWV